MDISMILDTIILPGVDPDEILRKTMTYCISVAVFPAVIFLSSETISGQFAGYRWDGLTSVDAVVFLIGLICFIGHFPLAFWIDFVGTQKLRDYLARNGQILERQLMGAFARLFRSSQLLRTHMLAVGTVAGLADAAIDRSLVGLCVYLVGQTLLVIYLPWPGRWDIWHSIRRKLILD